MQTVNIELQLLNENGLFVNVIIEDSEIHRVPTINKPKSLNGWYVAYPNVLVFGDWQTGMRTSISRKCDRPKINTKEVLAQISARNFYKEWKQEQAKRRAQLLYSQGSELKYCDMSQGYLLYKQIRCCRSVRKLNDMLIVPLIDLETNEICNLQQIASDGQKRFLAGGKVKGLCHPIGDSNSELLVICEGFATATSLIACNNNWWVLAAMNANNLMPIARKVKSLFPEKAIYIAADDDYLTEKKTGVNVGLEKAREAAYEVAASLLVPPFTEQQKEAGLTDWNDYYCDYMKGGMKDEY